MSAEYTFEQVAEHAAADDAWLIYGSKVYDVTAYLEEHPGGEEVILDCLGTDATEAFDDIGHSEDAHATLEALCIGTLVGGVPKVEKAQQQQQGSNIGLVVAGLVVVVAVVYFATQ